MRDLDKNALDRHITGNWGEDQFKEIPDEDELELDECKGCGGPDDHYPDCLPASEGGTMPDVVRS